MFEASRVALTELKTHFADLVDDGEAVTTDLVDDAGCLRELGFRLQNLGLPSLLRRGRARCHIASCRSQNLCRSGPLLHHVGHWPQAPERILLADVVDI